jgi:hypothetical protein
MALGEQPADVAQRVTTEIFAMALAAAGVGAALGLASARYVETLFYEIRAADPEMLTLPTVVVTATVFASA